MPTLRILLATTCLAAIPVLAPSQSAWATLTSTVSGGGIGTGCNATTATGALNTSCSGGAFSNVAITASAPPLLPAPDLTATTLTVTTGPAATFPVTLSVAIDSSGFAFAGGPVEAELTVNNLIGGPTGPFVLSAITPLGTETHTFTGGGTDQIGPINLGAFTTDSADFTLTFSGAGQSVDATIEILGVPVPEPSSFALLGLGLIGLGAYRLLPKSESGMDRDAA